MNTRLELFMRSEGLTAAKLAEILQVQPSSISHLLSGRNRPNFEFISRILRMFPELNPDWIINGEGEMYRSGSTVNREVTNNITSSYNSHMDSENTNNSQEFELITDVTSEKSRIKVPASENNIMDTGYDQSSGQTLFSQQENHIDDSMKNDDPKTDNTNKSVQPLSSDRSISNIDNNRKTESIPAGEMLESSSNSTSVDKIFVIYSDKTFEVYNQK